MTWAKVEAGDVVLIGEASGIKKIRVNEVHKRTLLGQDRIAALWTLVDSGQESHGIYKPDEVVYIQAKL
jgi:hypothetical protein